MGTVPASPVDIPASAVSVSSERLLFVPGSASRTCPSGCRDLSLRQREAYGPFQRQLLPLHPGTREATLPDRGAEGSERLLVSRPVDPRNNGTRGSAQRAGGAQKPGS